MKLHLPPPTKYIKQSSCGGARYLKQGATTMPTNFRPQIWFQVIISVIGSWCQNEIRTPAPWHTCASITTDGVLGYKYRKNVQRSWQKLKSVPISGLNQTYLVTFGSPWKVFLVIIDRGVESPTFNPFVGMLVGSCFKIAHPGRGASL